MYNANGYFRTWLLIYPWKFRLIIPFIITITFPYYFYREIDFIRVTSYLNINFN